MSLRAFFTGLAACIAAICCSQGLLAQGDCAALMKLSLPHTEITSAVVIPAGGYLASEKNPYFTRLPAFCMVSAFSRPSTDSGIAIEVWMPVEGWNGRYLGIGNSGFAGAVDNLSLANALYYGYAAAGTDAGHLGPAQDAQWALGHPEKVIDYGYRAVHEMTVTAKSLIEDYLGAEPKYSYFDGCSDGGREALMEAQRYPLDYNGIVSGDPTNDLTNLMTKGVIDMRALLDNPESYIQPSKLPAISAAVLSACRNGEIGEFLDDPARCVFKPASLLCKGGDAGRTDQCLTEAQVAAMGTLYAPATLPGVGVVFPGRLPGGELGGKGWESWVTGTAPGNSLMNIYAPAYFADMVYQNPHWTYANFNLAIDLAAAMRQTGTALDATDPDLTPFELNHGKIILYHGWNDPAVSALSSVNYYEKVIDTVGEAAAQAIIRLYMVPGMQHCGNGPGPTNFGGGGPATFNTTASDAQPGLYRAMELWVEKGIAPHVILTSGEVPEGNSEGVMMTRPLCPYPEVATYTGKGSQNEASSFVCAKDGVMLNGGGS